MTDVYSSMYNHTPLGIFGSMLWRANSTLLHLLDFFTPAVGLGTVIREDSGLLSILHFLAQTRDRRISAEDAEVVPLHEPLEVFGGRSMNEAAGLGGRYGSRCFETWMEVRYAMRRVGREEFEAAVGH